MCHFLQIFSSAGFTVALYDTVASQLTNALTSIESQLRDMEMKGLMRSPGMTAQEAFKLVTSYDDLIKALDGAMYVQVEFKDKSLTLNTPKSVCIFSILFSRHFLRY